MAALGSRGSSLSATGNLIGAVIGTAFAQICVAALGPVAVHWTFILHENRAALSGVVTGGRSSLSALRHHTMPTAVGCLAWISLSCAVVFLPSFFGELGMDTVRALGVIALLVFSAAGQILSPYLSRRVPWVSGVAALAVGVGAVLAGAATHLRFLAATSGGKGARGEGNAAAMNALLSGDADRMAPLIFDPQWAGAHPDAVRTFFGSPASAWAKSRHYGASGDHDAWRHLGLSRLRRSYCTARTMP